MSAAGPGRMTRTAIAVINGYRHMVSPLRPATCRFMPTCSQYAVDALTEYGMVRGTWLAAVRLGKCGPWHQGGWDPIPQRCGAGHATDSLPAGGSEATRESIPAGGSEATRESTPELRSADV